MQTKKIIDKLEHDLCHYLIGELTKNNPARRGSPEMFKYRGLSITANPKQKSFEKTISIRIGVLEAEFKVETGEKNSGALNPEEERLIIMWLQKSENIHKVRSIFNNIEDKKEIRIIPFDLEELFEK